ncbi:MAG: glycosyltransferase 87 family protein [Planctomycetota bacterium]
MDPKKDKTTSSSHLAANFISAAAAFILILMVVATGYRLYARHYPGPGIPNNADFGFCDFYNGIYYPSQAFLARDNPYGKGVTEDYPMSRPVPFFSPLVFLIHAPLAMLPQVAASIVYFGCLIAMVVFISRFAFQASQAEAKLGLVSALAACLLASRPGQIAVFNGYFTLELVIGSILAIHYPGKRPGLAVVGLVITSFKPTYAIPMFILMMARGYWRPAIIGATVSTVFAIGGLMWIAESTSLTQCIQIALDAQSSHHEFSNLWPVNTWTRIDLVCVFAKWLGANPGDSLQLIGMVLIVLLPCVLLLRIERQNRLAGDEPFSAAGPIGAICMLAMLVSLYHHFYDALILVVPAVGILLFKNNEWRNFSKFNRWLLFSLLVVPFVNYFSAKAILRKLSLDGTGYQLVTSVNGICLAIALVYLCICCWEFGQTASVRKENARKATN